jgi:hypothetical protein
MPRSTQAQVAFIAGLLYLLVGLALVAALIAGVSGGGVEVTSPLLLGALALGVFALAVRLFRLARDPRVAAPLPGQDDWEAPQTWENAAEGVDTVEQVLPSASDGAVPRPRAGSSGESARPQSHPNAPQGTFQYPKAPQGAPPYPNATPGASPYPIAPQGPAQYRNMRPAAGGRR